MNQYNALCQLASDEGWCWNLHCTTCGHAHFRYALAELASGKHPTDGAWIVHRRKTSYAKELGPLPRNYSDDQKGAVLAICTEADISLIASKCKFPNWLGYLGLVLVHMQCESDAYKSLSIGWALQLQGLVSKGLSTWHRLEVIVNQNALLSLEDLESVESYLILKY